MAPSLLSGFSSTLQFFLNGTEVILENPSPDTTLVQYLRSVGLTGTKLGCAEGGCGACTVLVSSYNQETKHISHLNVNSCLYPLCALDGKHVITIEGLGDYKNPHPVQERIALCFGSQCGFCTPGMAMSLYALLRNNQAPTEKEIENSFDGNLCRCTGYRPILDAAKSFAHRADVFSNGSTAIPKKAQANGGGCCGGAGPDAVCCRMNEQTSTIPQESSVHFPLVDFKKHDPTQEIIFPPRLMKRIPQPLAFQSEKTQYYRPTDLQQVLQIKALYPKAKLIGGNTNVGLEVRFNNKYYSHLVDLSAIEELKTVQISDKGITIGANVTIFNFQKALEEALKGVSDEQAHVLKAFLTNCETLANRQVRNVASVGGNVVTAASVSNLNPVFVAARATFKIISVGSMSDFISNSNPVPAADKNTFNSKSSEEGVASSQEISAEEFFADPKMATLLDQDRDVLTQIFIPLTRQGEYIRAFKHSKRHDDDMATITAAMRVQLSEDDRVMEASLVYGGMAKRICRLTLATKYLVGETWGDKDVLNKALDLLDKEMPLQHSSKGGMPEYRRTLAKSLFVRFWWYIIEQRKMNLQHDQGDLGLLTSELHRHVSRGTQDVKGAKSGAKTKVVNHDKLHVAAKRQATGEVKYTDDIPKVENELFGGFIFSTRAHAKIVSIDTSDALQIPGVRRYFGHKDIPGSNVWTSVLIPDEVVFAEEKVECVGQMIGMIVADTQVIANEAAQKVKVVYKDLPAIVTIEEAIAADSFFDCSRRIEKGNVDDAFKTCAKVFEGVIHLPGQEHFYMEPFSTAVRYLDTDEELLIHCTTQSPTSTQHAIAGILGISANKVTVNVRRLGGGFGGKDSRPIPMAAALAAASLQMKRAVRGTLGRRDDMVFSGGRHPFQGRWKVGLDENNKLKALDVETFLNAGYTSDMSPPVMEVSMMATDNAYFCPNVRVVAKCCRTNLPSSTAFRGFGSPQGNMLAESIMTEVADNIGLSQEAFRELNFYQEGQQTHYNQTISPWPLTKGYRDLMEKTKYKDRRMSLEDFNKRSPWRKRGLAMTPVKFGIGYAESFLNQGAALINIYLDGTVRLSHGGVEMGQGLHTKMIQVCAETLDIPMDIINIVDTSTDKVPNTTSTSASLSSDLHGMAVKDACNQINERLKSFRDLGMEWPQAVQAAYFSRISLSASGYYKVPDVGYDWKTNSGQRYSYYTHGVAVSEVEVDCLTGMHTVIRSDVSMDLGRSINPTLDIGQIEGGFVQGMGWVTSEELLFSPEGQMLTLGPGKYKIPSVQSIPQELNVSFFEGVDYSDMKTIYKSKGVGEPPFFLGTSVYFAIRDALKYARVDNGLKGSFSLPVPATPEKIRMLVGDLIAEGSRIEVESGEKPWSVSIS